MAQALCVMSCGRRGGGGGGEGGRGRRGVGKGEEREEGEGREDGEEEKRGGRGEEELGVNYNTRITVNNNYNPPHIITPLGRTGELPVRDGDIDPPSEGFQLRQSHSLFHHAAFQP